MARVALLLAVVTALVLGAPAAAAVPRNVLTCGSSGNENYSNATTSFSPVRSCTLDAPQSGTAIVFATASAGLADAPYEVLTQIGVDTAAGSDAHQRWTNVYSDAEDGTDHGVAHTAALRVGPGPHTFVLAARRYLGTGTVRLWRSQLSVIFVPDGARVQACGAAGDIWQHDTTAFALVAECAIQVAEPSVAVVVASGSVAQVGASDEYEALFGLSVDGVGADGTRRYVNLYDDPLTGTDKSVMTQLLTPVAPGAHTFRLRGRRTGGSALIRLYDPSITVISVPAGWARTATCGGQDDAEWTSNSVSLAPARSCDLAVPADGGSLALVGSASVSPVVPTLVAYEAWFRLRIDDPAGLDSSGRWVNVEPDADDGSDESVATTALQGVTGGGHALSLAAGRSGGSGAVHLYDPALAALWIAPPDTTAPAITVTARPPAETTERSARIAFTTDDPTATATCALDGAAAAPCAGAASYDGLAPGGHEVAVAAADEVGNDALATVRWTVLAPAPPAPPGPAAALPSMLAPPGLRIVRAVYDRRRGRLRITVRVGQAGALSAVATARRRSGRLLAAAAPRVRTVRVGRARRSVRRAGTFTLVLRLSSEARRATRARVRYTVSFKPGSGRTQTARGALTIRRAR